MPSPDLRLRTRAPKLRKGVVGKMGYDVDENRSTRAPKLRKGVVGKMGYDVDENRKKP